MNPIDQFEKLIDQLFSQMPSVPSLALISSKTKDQLVQFYRLVCEENSHQNLTRLISPEDFLRGHVLDVVELLKLNFLQYPALDLGSGLGVPGLLAALLYPEKWVLIESEGRKAEFLNR